MLDFEIANICVKKIRAHPASRAAIVALYNNYANFAIRIAPIQLDEVVSLADRLRLSSYDASYLWLARKLGAELVTLEKDLAKAAAKP